MIYVGNSVQFFTVFRQKMKSVDIQSQFILQRTYFSLEFEESYENYLEKEEKDERDYLMASLLEADHEKGI